MRRIASFVLTGLCWLIAGGCSRPSRDPREPSQDRPSLTVMTYNVNYGIPGDPDTLAAIRDGGAGVVFLQETNEGWEEALRRELGGLYPHMAFKHCCRAGGLAVLSRFPFEEKEYIDAPEGG